MTSRITGSYARMRSPWNGGSITFRRDRCSSPSSRSSERAPTSGLSVIWRPGGILWPRSPYSARITSGFETITSGVWKPWNVTSNVSPYRRRQSSRKRIGRATHRAVCTAGDSLGPGIALTTTDRSGAAL